MKERRIRIENLKSDMKQACKDCRGLYEDCRVCSIHVLFNQMLEEILA